MSYVLKLRQISKEVDQISANRQVTEMHQQTEMRLIKNILIIFLTYVVCTLPITLVSLFTEKMAVIAPYAYILAWSRSVIDPFMYVFKNSEYQKVCKSLLCRQDCCGKRNVETNLEMS